MSALFAPATFRLTVAVTREGRRAELARGDRLPAALLGDASRRTQPVRLDRDAGEGLEAPLLERRLPRREEDLHGADERGDERPRDLRSRLTFDRGRARTIR